MTWLDDTYDVDAEASYLAAIVEPMATCSECGGTGRWYDEAWGGERLCECQPNPPAPAPRPWSMPPDPPLAGQRGLDEEAGW